MDFNKLKAIAIIAIAAFGALYLGIAAATAQMEAMVWIGGGLIATVCLALGRRIWLLLPLMTSLSLILPLPGGFTSMFLTQFLVLGFSTLLFLMRRLPFEIRITELEIWCLLILACVLQVYMRNPVGLNILGTGSVGGKDYVIFGMSFLTAALISTLRVEPRDIIWYVRLVLIGSIGNFLLGAFAKFFPTMGFLLAASFSTDVGEDPANEDRATRVSYVRRISTTIALWVSSRISPLRGSFHPIYAPLILISLAFAAASGFRSQLILVGLFYLVGTAYRGGFSSVLISSILGALVIVLLAFVNLVMPLPPNIQRSLTILPGTWEEQYRTDTKGSTDWRVEMWKEALFTDKWIQNKLLGDGLGMTREELEAIAAINEGTRTETAIGGMTSGQVNMMLAGGYHSGPVQTVRMVGYLGLAILMLGFFRMMVHAHRQIQRTRGTEWYYPTLFICLPIIVSPISWTLVIGSFSGGTGVLTMGCAMLRLLQRNLPLPAYVTARHIPYILQSNSRQQPVRTTG